MALFEGYNPISKKNLTDRFMPTDDDLDFLFKLKNYNKKKEISEENLDRLAEIENGVDRIISYNNELIDKFKCRDDDYRLIDLSEVVLDAINDTQKNLGILTSGGINAYRKDKIKEGLERSPFHNHNHKNAEAEMMLHFPEDYNRKLKPKGNWIMIAEDINCVSAPQKYDIHYATPIAKSCTVMGVNAKRWYASILVNNKEVLIEPREYVCIYDANKILQAVDKGIEMIEGSTSARLDKNKVFYLKSRGFNQAEIYQILFKSITNKGFCHFRCSPEWADKFDYIKQGMLPKLAMRFDEHMKTIPVIKFEKPC